MVMRQDSENIIFIDCIGAACEVCHRGVSASHRSELQGTLSVHLCYITDCPKMWLKATIFITFHILWIGSNFALPVLPAFTQAAACRWRISWIQRLRRWHVWDWALAVGWEPRFSPIWSPIFKGRRGQLLCMVASGQHSKSVEADAQRKSQLQPSFKRVEK